MLGQTVSDQPAVDVAPSIKRLERMSAAARVRSFHGSFLSLSAAGTGLAHAFYPDPDDMVVLIHPLRASEFGLLYADRPFSLHAHGQTQQLHLVRVVPVPMSERFLLCDPIGQDCLLAHQDWHLNKGGPIGFGRLLPGPDAQFLFDIADIPLIADEAMASVMLGMMTMLDANSPADPGDRISVAVGNQHGSLFTRLLDTLLAACRVPQTEHARLGAQADSLDGLIETRRLGRESFVSIGPFEHRLDYDPTQVGILQRLGGGWLAVQEPNFGNNGSADDKLVRVFATGKRATISFFLPYRPSQARLRLAISDLVHEANMTVSANGWEVGRSPIGKKGGAKKRLDYIIKGEAIQSDQLTIQIDFDRLQDAPGTLTRLFLLSGCQLDLGPEASAVEIPDDPVELLNRFESIGVNCEFGFVQRHFGVERLGVLTFAGVRQMTNLLDLLDEGFAGLGAPGSIEAREVVFSVRARNMPPCDVREFWITNQRYQFEMHTFKGSEHHSREEAIRENEKKLSYLSRKLIEDLEDAEKILVYKDVRFTDLNDVLSLHASLNRYGPNRLFWVTHPIPGRPAGSVEWIAPNLLRGYSFNPHADVQWFNADHWLLLCRRAYAAFMAAG